MCENQGVAGTVRGWNLYGKVVQERASNVNISIPLRRPGSRHSRRLPVILPSLSVCFRSGSLVSVVSNGRQVAEHCSYSQTTNSQDSGSMTGARSA